MYIVSSSFFSSIFFLFSFRVKLLKKNVYLQVSVFIHVFMSSPYTPQQKAIWLAMLHSAGLALTEGPHDPLVLNPAEMLLSSFHLSSWQHNVVLLSFFGLSSSLSVMFVSLKDQPEVFLSSFFILSPQRTSSIPCFPQPSIHR